MAGDFVRGQKTKLSDLTTYTTLKIGVGITGASGQVFDVSCFGVDTDNKLSDDRYFIFYNQKSSPCGSLVCMGGQAGDLDTFQVDLAR